jgi:hypothetical protein
MWATNHSRKTTAFLRHIIKRAEYANFDMPVITVILQRALNSTNCVIPFLGTTQQCKVHTSGLTTRKWRFLVPSVTVLSHRIRGIWGSPRDGAWICLITWSKCCIIFSLHESFKCKPSTSSLWQNTRSGSISEVLSALLMRNEVLSDWHQLSNKCEASYPTRLNSLRTG